MLNETIKCEVPARIAKLPLDERGYPVPWFVAWLDDKPDFRVIRPERPFEAVQERRCWICGDKLGRFQTFVIGPMCAVNRISAEPPSHRDCAQFAAQACPFMTRPQMKRNQYKLPEETHDPPGIALKRNPGVTLLWTTLGYRVIEQDGGILFRIGHALSTEWYAEGRRATRDEVMHAIDTGLPLLLEPAEKDDQKAVKAIRQGYLETLKILPA